MSKRYYIYIIALIVLIVIFDKGVGRIYNFLYFSEQSFKNDRLIHSALGTSEDCLIFGSSRAYHHYNPKIFEDSLEMSCYNVGYGGQNIYFHTALLNSAINRYIPKIVILDLFDIDFEKTSKRYETERLSVLLPFTTQNQIYYNTVLKRGWNEKIKLYSNVYPFNSKLLQILRNNIVDTVKSNYKGYVGLSRMWNKPISVKENFQAREIDNDKFSALEDFIVLCQNHNIRVYLFVSPIFRISNSNNYDEILSELKRKYSVSGHNFERDSLFLENHNLFADIVHLNKQGADIYTKKIVKFIQSE